MPGWTFAEIWEAAADHLPAAAFAKQGDRSLTWGDADRRADGVARTLLDAGAGKQDKVAQYLYNCPEYLETVFACSKASLVPVNTNYRYTEDELVYLWDNADAVAVVFHGSFVDTIEAIRERVPNMQTWLWVDDGSGPCPDWATPYEDAASRQTERVLPDHGRDGDDLYMLYTGGTTGMPKGVMWRQEDLIIVLCGTLGTPLPDDRDPSVLEGMFQNPGAVGMPACPLMHGTGAFTSFSVLSAGGCVVLLPGRHFDPEELLDEVEAKGVNAVAIVGDAFAKPILDVLDANEGRWDLSSLMAMTSSGVMWSEETKQGQGTGEVGEHLHSGRRQALLLPRRLRRPRGGRHGHRARPRLGVHQHRRGEGLSRGGGRGGQDPRRRARRRGGRRPPRALRRDDRRRRGTRGRTAGGTSGHRPRT